MSTATRSQYTREYTPTAPLTKDEALTANTFHDNIRRNADGSCVRYRRNGKTQTWVTRPTEYRIPVKYGIRAKDQFSLTRDSAGAVHTEETCPYANH